MNLLGNALKFTEEGTITVSAQRREERIVITIADTGIGIPADALELIFEEFRQLDSSATRRYSGTGLGLSISRHLTRFLGGDLTVTSAVGVGSTFTVTIPLRSDYAQPTTRTATPADGAPRSAPSSRAGQRGSQAMKKILIVEDVEGNQDLIVQLLEDQYEIFTAANGEEGIQLAERQRPDLILMDLSLPIIDGWEATRRIKANAALQNIPIIALSAHAMTGDEEKARQSGCDDYLSKPLDEDSLFAKLTKFLGRKSDDPSVQNPDRG